MGQAERELRNLEEQVETEKSKDFRSKLEQVQRDLVEIKKEIEVLMWHEKNRVESGELELLLGRFRRSGGRDGMF